MYNFSLLFFTILFLTSIVRAQGPAQTTHSLDDVDRVVVRAYAGQLQVVPSSGPEMQVQIRRKGGVSTGQHNLYQIQEKDRTLEIRLTGASETDAWTQVLSSQTKPSPEYEMKLSLPPQKLEIFWHQGLVFIDKFKGDVAAQVSQGDIKAQNSEGQLSLQLIKGRLQVNDHKGPMDIQTFQGQTQIKNTAGLLSLDNFSADVNITGHKGSFEFKNHSGAVIATKVQGALTIKNVSGTLTVTDVDGSLKGEMGSGRLTAKFQTLQNFSLQNESGTISLQVPKTSGALVSVRSQKGQIYVPPYLGKRVRGQWTERSGQLRGSEQGNIKILSKYGDVVLK